MPVERKPLFRPDVLRPYVDAFQPPSRVADNIEALRKWSALLTSPQAAKLKEQELLRDFLNDVFVTILGYQRPADDPGGYTFSPEKHVVVDGKYADAVIGDLAGDAPRYVVALEGKGPTDPLDRPFKSRKMSAVDQGYRYAINLPCDWIIVTSMRETRLYYKGADQLTFERFRIEDLANKERALKRFVFLLGAERVVPASGVCHLDRLREASNKAGKELTKDFYLRYAEMREDLFEQLCGSNPNQPRKEILSAAQKLLDRVLFCAFCEDRGLLPDDTLAGAFEHRDPYNPRPIWQNFQGLFRSIDTGNATLNIPAYNGGLFAEDPLLDHLDVPDAACKHFHDIGNYDYRPISETLDESEESRGTLIDVDILGHLFEQSISDLEHLRNELEGLVPAQGKERHKTRRKKEGAFYTPAFITRYIIEQTLGRVLEDRFEALRGRHADGAKGSAVAALADPRVYDAATLNKPQREALVAFWEGWQDELATVRVLDPACGSGAFLIEAFDQLHAVYTAANDRLEELRGHRTLFDLDRQILRNNLYGVDLNEEAIQICRLSLWIKTAQRGKALTSLDHTIRVGNSVVDDPAVHPLAFDWAGTFPEVTAAGGFDVVVGNPPYIRQEWIKDYKEHWAGRYESFASTADIYIYFFELGVNLLKPNGRLGFITSGSWVRGNFGAGVRGFLAERSQIESMIDFGEFQPFEGAEMIRPTIAVAKKSDDRPPMRLYKWLTKGHPPEHLSDVIANEPTLQTTSLGKDRWELESDVVNGLKRKLTDGKNTLRSLCDGNLYRGVITGLTDAFVIGQGTYERLCDNDAKSKTLLQPYLRGQDIRPWSSNWQGLWLIKIPSSGDRNWAWSSMPADKAERCFEEQFPAIFEHLQFFRERLIKRQDQGRFWWELRSCAYWDRFSMSKIIWPDIAKLPRFCMDLDGYAMGNTGYFVSADDPYLHGVLSSWATWFYISKTAQPLRLRGDRWQYRLFSQFMEEIPIPEAPPGERIAISDLSASARTATTDMYKKRSLVCNRMCQTFASDSEVNDVSSLNKKATDWWVLSFNQLGDALKTSFKLKGNPFKNPRTADEWEPYFNEKKAEVQRLSRQIADAEAELNERVYRLFDLTKDEIKLLEQEVAH